MGRSRSGCANCKRRKRKCDESRPQCRECLTRGVQCSGYEVALRWDNGIASRGRFAGAVAPVANFVAVASGSGEAPAAPSPSSLPIEDYSTPATSSPETTVRHNVSLQPTQAIEDQRLLFQKFLEHGIHRLYTTRAGCWLEPFLEQISRQSDALFAVSVAIQAYLDQGLSVSALRHADHAIQTFRAELATRHEPMVASTMHAGLFICTLSLLQARPWTKYLELMVDLYHLRGDLWHLDPDPQYDLPTRHALEVMAVMDLPSFVIGRASPSVGIWRRLRQIQSSWHGGRMGGVEIISGMPRSLLDIFVRANDDDLQDVETDLWLWPGEIGEFLQCHLWDSWRFAGILNIRRRERVELRSTRHHRMEGRRDPTGSGRGTPPETEVILCRLLSAMHSLHQGLDQPENRHLLVFNGLLYPLVAASLEVPLVRRYPEWKALLDRTRAYFVRTDSAQATGVLFEVLDEAWSVGGDDFDVEGAARRNGVEIAVF